jgi:hypothetical protein
MSYQENIESLASEMGVAYPLQEDDLGIVGIVFSLKTGATTKSVRGNESNREERLFLEHYVRNVSRDDDYIRDVEAFKARAVEFFDDDQGGNRLLDEIKDATIISIVWKNQMLVSRGVP